ncbi:MAG: putative pterin-4-alpha-carbinolamine dehydratase [Acidimicrobiales bacterium]|nr:MAG: putative pterin-4-alpha-carbinolamine dehydratase [Acidimicrobiales bacterium]
MAGDEVLAEHEIQRELESMSGWELRDGKLHRSFVFADFGEAFAFMTRVALSAERMNHHPDWSNSWNRVEIDIVSHSAGGVTTRCIELARQISEFAPTP